MVPIMDLMLSIVLRDLGVLIVKEIFSAFDLDPKTYV